MFQGECGIDISEIERVGVGDALEKKVHLQQGGRIFA